MWEQTLSGLIKALRASKNDEARVVEAALEEIAVEVKSNDWELKAGAVLKLTYLDMLGYAQLQQSFAFQVIECMSCPKFHIKQIGYLAASNSFHYNEDSNQVLILLNNLIKKDLTSTHSLQSHPIGLLQTLSTLPPILSSSQQLADDLEPDLLRQLSHSKPAVRRAAVLVLGSLWRQNGIADEQVIERLGEKLLDEDNSVITATVNVMLELVRRSGPSEAFLRLAPECFQLLTSSSNNWMLIKIVKWFSLLTPIEPRLVKKLLPPITNLIQTTPAMSLLYECIHAVIAGGMLHNNDPLAKTCVSKLTAFLSDSDQNLRYIALLAIHKLLPSHPHLIASYSTMILKCVDDADSSIRHRALDLVEGMVDQHTLPNVVRKLLTQLTGSQYKDRHLSSPAAAALSSIANSNGSNASSGASSIHSPAYKSSVIHRILRILQQNNYANVSDFEWLVDLLIELAFIAATLPQSTTLQQSIGQVLVDVSARARAIRPYAVKKCIHLLSSAHPSNDNTLGEHVAWIVGEYCTADDDDNPLEWQAAITALREAEQTHSAVKVFAKWAAHVSDSGSWRESGGEALKAVRSEAEALRESEDVQSAHELLALLTMTAANLEQPDVPPTFSTTTTQEDNPFASDGQVSKEVDLSSGAPLGLRLLKSLYLPELNPVNPRAQSLVGVPEGLDLDAWIVPNSIINLPAESSAMAAERDEVDEFGRPRGVFASVTAQSLELLGGNGKTERTKEKKKKKGRKGESEGEDGRKKRKSKRRKDGDDDEDVDNIPIVKLDLSDLPGVTQSKARSAVKGKGKNTTVKPVVLDIDGELPPEALRRSPVPPPATANSSASATPLIEVEQEPSQAKADTPQSTSSAEQQQPVQVKKVKSTKAGKKKKAKVETTD